MSLGPDGGWRARQGKRLAYERVQGKAGVDWRSGLPSLSAVSPMGPVAARNLRGGLRKPERGQREAPGRELLGPARHTRCAASGRAVPSLDVRVSSCLLEALCMQKTRRQEKPASFRAVCFSSRPLLEILAGNRFMTSPPPPSYFLIILNTCREVASAA